jgi:hypothetical protein
MRTFVLPAKTDVSAFETPNALSKAASPTENGTVAKGDKLVFALNASGLSGFLKKSMLDGSGENVSIHFRETNAERNSVPNEFDGDEATRLMMDDENDILYLIVDTGNPGIEAGDRYDVTFKIGEENGLVTEPERATTNVSVEKRRVSLDCSGDVLIVGDHPTVGGTTNLAPGSTVNVTAYKEGAVVTPGTFSEDAEKLGSQAGV